MIGGNVQLRDLRIASLTTNARPPVFESSRDSLKRFSVISAVVLVSKGAIATDGFAMVHSSNAGVIMCALICVSVFFLTQGSMYIFTLSWAFEEAYSYVELWRLVFGSNFSAVPFLCIVIGYLMCTVNGFCELNNCLPRIITSVFPNSSDIATNKWFLNYAMAVIVLLPLLGAKRISGFIWVS
jgi:hypothetical protein